MNSDILKKMDLRWINPFIFQMNSDLEVQKWVGNGDDI